MIPLQNSNSDKEPIGKVVRWEWMEWNCFANYCEDAKYQNTTKLRFCWISGKSHPPKLVSSLNPSLPTDGLESKMCSDVTLFPLSCARVQARSKTHTARSFSTIFGLFRSVSAQKKSDLTFCAVKNNLTQKIRKLRS